MISVGVNPPKTPVTAGSNGFSAATTPNVCKMPGPPAPFVPTPLPNIGRSDDRPGDYTTTVLIEGTKVAVHGSYFMSKGDVASQGTGGGLISQTTQGKTEFVAPGSMNIQAEGKNIQQLGDFMTNNGSNPTNGGTTPKEAQAPAPPAKLQTLGVDCEKKLNKKTRKWDSCMVKQLCAMVNAYNNSPGEKKQLERSPSNSASRYSGLSEAEKDAQNLAKSKYDAGKERFAEDFEKLVDENAKDSPKVIDQFHSRCQWEKWRDAGYPRPVPRSKLKSPVAMNPDHVHPAGLGGSLEGPFKWADSEVNSTVGPAMDQHDPEQYPGGMKAQDSCKCDGENKP